MSNNKFFMNNATTCTKEELSEIILTVSDAEVRKLYEEELERRLSAEQEVSYWEKHYEQRD